MIRQFNINDLDKCTKLIEQCNKGNLKVRYFPLLKNEVEKRLISRLNSNDHKMLVAIDNSKIVGFMELFIEVEEKYVQILSFFARTKFNHVFDMCVEFMRINLSEFSLDYVISDFNEDSIKYMKSIGAKTDGKEIMINIRKEEFIETIEDTATELNEKHHSDFIELHNKFFPEVYWKGDLLVKEINKFKIFVILEKNILLGYAVLSCFGRDEEEIYFIYSKNRKSKIQLINKSLGAAFKWTESVLILLTSEEKDDLQYYLDIGFHKKEVIYVYHMTL
ncbi:MAG: hypothetical protein KKH01_07550 [Firmicutes bacterium]|nr:hypothetical protein [Bacillota bacterium]